MLTVARLVLVEATRRRLVLAVVLLTLAAVALTAWGFSRIPYVGPRPLPPEQLTLVASQLLILVAFMFSFVLALSAVFVATPAISGETETGIALAVLARPLSRASYIVGKWLGLALLLLLYSVASIALELIAVGVAVGYQAPDPLRAFLFLYVEALVLLTLGLALSTRLSGMVGGVITLALFGMGWIVGIVAGVGQVLGNDALIRIGTIAKLILPTDGLWRGSINALEPVAMLALARAGGAATAANPFFSPEPPPVAFVLWAVAWIPLVLGLAILSFRSREV